MGVLLLSADLVIEYVNPFFYEVWGEIGGEKSLVGKVIANSWR